MVIETKVKVGGAWKALNTIEVKVGGVWKAVSTIEAKVGGTWETVHSGSQSETVVVTVGHSSSKGGHYDGWNTPGLIGSVNPGTIRGHTIYVMTAEVLPDPDFFLRLESADLGANFFDTLRVQITTGPTYVDLQWSDATYFGSAFISTWLWAGTAVDWHAEDGLDMDVEMIW